MAPLTRYLPLVGENSTRYLFVRGSVKLRQRIDSVREIDGIDVMDEEWDNLFILDGCRYDLFEQHHEFPGTLEMRRSAASHSSEFVTHNFAGRDCTDTVYVTGNPYSTLAQDAFHATVNLFEDAWDEDLLTVHPESVVQAASRAHERYPRKRLIVHFMQPHHPFIGPVGRDLDTGGVTGHVHADVEAKTERASDSIWDRLDVGECPVDRETVWDAYVDNFRFVADYASTLADGLDGKTVLTADHGNLFGERLWPIPVRKYGHPRGVRHPALVDVPWHELPFDGRRLIEAEASPDAEAVDEEVIEDRLEALGYA